MSTKTKYRIMTANERNRIAKSAFGVSSAEVINSLIKNWIICMTILAEEFGIWQAVQSCICTAQ
jgi:hypothetical protein